MTDRKDRMFPQDKGYLERKMDAEPLLRWAASNFGTIMAVLRNREGVVGSGSEMIGEAIGGATDAMTFIKDNCPWMLEAECTYAQIDRGVCIVMRHLSKLLKLEAGK